MDGTALNTKAENESADLVDATFRFGKYDNFPGLFLLFVDLLQEILEFSLFVGLVAYLHHLRDVVIGAQFH